VNLHIDPESFRPVIEVAVAAAILRLRSERPTDRLGRILLSKREAADALGVSIATLDRLTAPRGDLRCVRLDGRVLYSPEAIREWIAVREAEGGRHED
jgi:predicted DNA-binding transcriptional regulator AlpA